MGSAVTLEKAQMRTRKATTEIGTPRPKKSSKPRLIGEQIGPKRMIQMRLFQTREEAEMWTSAAPGRRFRLVRVGSVAWLRALDEELKVVSTENNNFSNKGPDKIPR